MSLYEWFESFLPLYNTDLDNITFKDVMSQTQVFIEKYLKLNKYRILDIRNEVATVFLLKNKARVKTLFIKDHIHLEKFINKKKVFDINFYYYVNNFWVMEFMNFSFYFYENEAKLIMIRLIYEGFVPNKKK